jgi:UDP-N-acetylglucosamine 1-carboxyvinyltransferase
MIQGGYALQGDIVPQGAKNEALQVLCAVLLTAEPVVISNIPDISDVRNLIEILRLLGVEIEVIAPGTFKFTARNTTPDMMKTPEYIEVSEKIRASVMAAGPMLGRFGKAYISQPGGDKIGRRPLTTHFEGFQQLGAKISQWQNQKIYLLESARLNGTYMLLNEASVTGTANIIMAAVLARGTTTIFNAACEPYIVQLCNMLSHMGACIAGIGSNLLTITGVEKLHGCKHHILPDMIEVGSFIGLAAITRSDIVIKGCAWEHLGIIPYTFEKLGIHLERQGDHIHIAPQDEYEIARNMDGSILTIADAPWPGFTPDLISIILVTAIQAKGSLLVHQKMFESRLFFVDKLQDMGAQIILCDPHRATVIGLNRQYNMRGMHMTSPDIRAGVALLIAALSATGESVIQNVEQIDRGYEKIVERLSKIGAKIERCH